MPAFCNIYSVKKRTTKKKIRLNESISVKRITGSEDSYLVTVDGNPCCIVENGKTWNINHSKEIVIASHIMERVENIIHSFPEKKEEASI